MYAHSLVESVEKNIPLGAVSNGDGGRNMDAFVTPLDSMAIIAAHTLFQGGMKGLARSMPTSAAIDYVAKAKGFEYFEVPTGTKNTQIRSFFLFPSQSMD